MQITCKTNPIKIINLLENCITRKLLIVRTVHTRTIDESCAIRRVCRKVRVTLSLSIYSITQKLLPVYLRTTQSYWNFSLNIVVPTAFRVWVCTTPVSQSFACACRLRHTRVRWNLSIHSTLLWLGELKNFAKHTASIECDQDPSRMNLLFILKDYCLNSSLAGLSYIADAR